MTPRIAALLGMLWCWSVSAHDSFGPVYPINEPDMIDEIMEKLKKKEASGEIAKLQNEAKERSYSRMMNPAPVEGVSTARKGRVFYFDPTVVANETIYGPRGEVIVPAGTQANPLDMQDFGAPMLFFDARDERQVSKAKKLFDREKGYLMPVLTGGSFVELMKKWKTRVYYDQTGFLTRKLGIQFVPALVTQAGNKLKIEEFMP